MPSTPKLRDPLLSINDDADTTRASITVGDHSSTAAAAHYQEELLFRSNINKIWGPEVRYELCAEEKASLLSRCYYNWIGDFIFRAAREELTATSMPPPTQSIRTWAVGKELAEAMHQQLSQRHHWDRFIGNDVVLSHTSRKDAYKRNSQTKRIVGTLRWVGELRRSKTPTEVLVGVEWKQDPSTWSLNTPHNGTIAEEKLFCQGDMSPTAPLMCTCEKATDVDIVFTQDDLESMTKEEISAASVPPKKPSALWAFLSVHKWKFLEQVPFKLLGDYLSLANPLILEALVGFLTDDNPPWQHGAIILAVIFGFNVLQSLGTQKFYHLSIRLGSIVRNSFIGAIFEKCATISPKSLTIPEMSVGRVVNMVSTDVERADDFCWYAMYLWGAPQQLIIAVVLLYRLVGWCAFAGLSAMLLTMPLQTFVAKKQQALRILLSKTTDQRVKVTTELLSGIRIVKFMAWEKNFIEKVQVVRRQELLYLKEIQFYRVLTSLMNVATPTLVIATVLTLFHASGHELTAKIVFPTISVLNLMRMPFGMLPFVFTALVQLLVAMGRVTRFFECENEKVGSVADIEERALFDSQLCQYAAVLENTTVSAYMPVKLPPLLGGLTSGEESHIASICKRMKASCSCMLCSSEKNKATRKQRDGEKKPLLSGESTSQATNSSPQKPSASPAGKKSKDPEEFFFLEEKQLLKNITLKIPKGKLTVVVGPTGSGKSTLLETLLGQFDISEGTVLAPRNRIAYAPQQPWIMNATVRDNITFFSDFDAERFEKAIEACELRMDLATLINGVDTEIGEKGVNLSGGQRARVSLARAVYAAKDLYLLDDPLSALDAHVSELIVTQCICGALKHTTRILCTHHTHVLARADFIIVLNAQGNVCYSGDYSGYLTHPTAAREMSSSPTTLGSRNPTMLTGTGGGFEDLGQREPTQILSRDASQVLLEGSTRGKGLPGESSEDDDLNGAPDAFGDDALDEAGAGGGDKVIAVDDAEVEKKRQADMEQQKGKLMTEEEKAVGSVPWKTYMRYAQACGGNHVVFWVILIFAFTEVLSVSSTVWLSFWSVKDFGLDQSTYLYIFLGCVASGMVSAPLRFYYSYNVMRLASLNLHQGVLFSIASAPMSFFDTTPLGRIINRFARDIDQCDNALQISYLFLLQTLFSAFSTAAMMLSSQPYAVIAMIPASVFYYRIMVFYNAANRELRRISSNVKSPVFALLTEALTGSRTIRAYGRENAIMREAHRRLDICFGASYMQNVANRWLGIRIEFIANIIITTVAGLAVFGKILRFGSGDVGLLALGFTMALSITQLLNWIVRQTASVEADMNSVERLVYYTDNIAHEDLPALTSQMYLNQQSLKPITRDRGTQCPSDDDEAATVATSPPVVATEGQGRDEVVIEYIDVDMRYRDNLPLVLNNLSFKIRRNDKVGVVGRTGSGKSSLLLTFLRIVDTCGGDIFVSGRPIRSFGLHELRNHFSMIPQDPLLFEGTVRSNLDPFGCCSTAEIINALRLVGLSERIAKEPQGVDSKVMDNGSNFSVGQRQLLCLARALLKKGSSFILMDEATANIDPGLDKLIQATVKTAFVNHTVITIAHRLHTVLEYNTILVMDKGRVAESGRPWDLANDKKSTLRAMIASNGAETEAKLLKLVERSKKRYRKQSHS